MQVIQGDVDEALRLMRMSKISLEDEEQQDAVMNDPVREAFSKVRAASPADFHALCVAMIRFPIHTHIFTSASEQVASHRMF